MEWIHEFAAFICGFAAMGIVWFINDNGKNSPYQRGFHDGYDIGIRSRKGEENGTNGSRDKE